MNPDRDRQITCYIKLHKTISSINATHILSDTLAFSLIGKLIQLFIIDKFGQESLLQTRLMRLKDPRLTCTAIALIKKTTRKRSDFSDFSDFSD